MGTKNQEQPRFQGWGTLGRRRREVRRVRFVVAFMVFVWFFLALSAAANTPDFSDPEVQWGFAGAYGMTALLVAAELFWHPSPAFIEGDAVYGDRIPPRALLRRGELGQFPASQVTRAEVRVPAHPALRDRVEVRLLGPDGRRATFAGLAPKAVAAAVARWALPLTAGQRQELVGFGGGTAFAVAFARERGIPVEGDVDALEPPPTAREASRDNERGGGNAVG